MTTPKPQVSAAHYRRAGYLNLSAHINHWHQAEAVRRRLDGGGRVLEIGPGSGHTTWLLRLWGIGVVTADIDPDLDPDLVADVCDLPVADGEFDCVLAAQVLEHLPFDRFVPAARELARASKRSVIITLPAPLMGLAALVNLPRLRPRHLSVGLARRRPLRPGGEHFWELGRKGYPRRRIRRALGEAGVRVVSEYRPGISLFCRFFVCEKSAP